MKRTRSLSQLPNLAPQAATNAGFTLIEVLCALALSGLLLTAVYGAIHMQWKFRSAGEARIEHAQVWQGVIQDIASDVRCLPAMRTPEPKQLDTKTTFTGIGFVAMTDIREQFLHLNSLTKREIVEFYGSSEFMLLNLALPNSRFHSGNSNDSDSQQIVWLAADGNEVRVPFFAENEQLRFRSLRTAAVGSGLTRAAFTASDLWREAATASLGLTQTNSTSIAPEVSTIRFRFFDGQQWQPEWDSLRLKRLPQAIEVTLINQREAVPRTVVVRVPQSG